jgi:very-short-patch-repair endonuclease
MDKILKKYKDRLNDISRRNRAIRLSRIIKKKTFDLADLKKIDKDLPLKVIESIVHNGRSVNLIRTNISTKEEETILREINYLRRDVEFIHKEKGYYECFLGYPFIQGNFYEGSFFRCPLFLYPVIIEYNRAIQKIELKPLTDELPVINKTFFLAFNKYNKGFKNVNIEELEEIENLERKDLLEWALNLFRKLKLDVDVSNFSEKSINTLEPLKKDEHPSNLQGKIEVIPLGIIGEFSQLNSALNNDYETIISQKYLNDISKMLLGDIEERDLEERFDEEKLIDQTETENFFITKPDISQEQVLVESRKGKGLVIHGPPGTGKSQVIANLISDNLIRKKKILVVCEKRAALDVVNNRLAAKGLNKYCLLVHDSQNDRNTIFQKISSTLDEYDSNDGRLNVNTSNAVMDLSKKFDTEITELKKTIDIIHDKNKFNTNLYTLYRKSNKNSPIILNLNNEIFDGLKFNDLDVLLNKFTKIAKFIYIYDDKQNPLFFRKPFNTSFNEIDFKENIFELNNIFESIQNIFYHKDIKRDIRKISSKETTFEDLITISPDLTYYKENKNKLSRILNPKWIRINFRYKHLLKDGDIESLLIRWKTVEDSLNAFLNKISFLEENFRREFLDLLKYNILSFKDNSPIFHAIINLLKKVDDVIVLDTIKGELNDAEKHLLSLCYGQIKYAPKNDMGLIWGDIVQNSFYLRWINILESENRALRDFSFKHYNLIRNELLNIFNKKLELIPKLANEIYQNRYGELKWQSYDGDGRRKNYNNLNYLIHEVNKKRRRISMRQLIEKFINQGLFDLFPCWMCSPETASSVFPLKKDLFDMVIFDEASQCKIEKAIPSIIRAKKIIVAGDEKQLPPTTFFLSNMDDDEDLEELDDEEQQLLEDESLLVRAKTIFTGKRLLYHYRSKHHELIDFSNYAFYGGSLRVLPRNQSTIQQPITFVKTKGIWDNNCNMTEAKELVKLLKELLIKNNKGLTFGIITFNIKQKDIIEDLIEEEAKNDPIFGRLVDSENKRYNKEEYIGLFVKNIENVQGDERDVIIFSVGYGFDKSGTFRYRFGPLNGVYGKNRLNVAISRAKEKVYVFASFDPRDLKYEGKYEGPKLLGKYLAYCEAISKNDEKLANNILIGLNQIETMINEYDEYDSDFEGEVRDELVKLGYKVKTQVGCKGYKIDLGILHPKNKNRFMAGIECDGAAYHSLKSAKDRDIYRQSVLEDNGWKIFRIWSRDWWKDSGTEIKRIDRELKAIL